MEFYPKLAEKKHSNRFRILPRNGLESQISNHGDASLTSLTRPHFLVGGGVALGGGGEFLLGMHAIFGSR